LKKKEIKKKKRKDKGEKAIEPPRADICYWLYFA
jgi:hypothetical protein